MSRFSFYHRVFVGLNIDEPDKTPLVEVPTEALAAPPPSESRSLSDPEVGPVGLYPCSNCRKFYKGPAQAAYPALVMGSESEREHLRLCPPCFEEILDTCQTQLYEAIAGETAGLAYSHCLDCGDAPGRAALFVTLYPSKEEPRQFYGRLADSCVASARATWLVRDP